MGKKTGLFVLLVLTLQFQYYGSEIASSIELEGKESNDNSEVETSLKTDSVRSQIKSEVESPQTKTVNLGDTKQVKKEVKDNKVITQGYDDDLLQTEIVVDGDYKYVNMYEDEVLVKSSKYLNDVLIQEDQYENGIIVLSTVYDNNVKTVLTYSNNVITSLKKYQLNKLTYEELYHSNGTIKQSLQYDSNGRISNSTMFNSAGIIISSKDYKNGQLTCESIFKNGVISEKKKYNAAGIIVEKNVFENGNKSSVQSYDSTGKLISNVEYYTASSNSKKRIRVYNADRIVTEDTTYYSTGQIDQQKYFNNAGIQTHRYIYNKNKLSIEYKYNDRGVYTNRLSYYSNGKVSDNIFYNNEKKIKKLSYDEKGNQIGLSTYKSNQDIAKTTFYYTNGKIKTVYNYFENVNQIEQSKNYSTDGKLISVITHYSNGNLKKSSQYENGKVTYISEYDKQGQLQKRDYYEQGIRRRTKKYNSNRTYTITYYTSAQTPIRVNYYNKSGNKYQVKSYLKTKKRSGYKTKTIKACDMSTTRQKNVVVDIGFDSSYANRDYYGYTNRYGQLTLVEAAQIIPQSESEENVVWGYSGDGKELRYCKSEARVIGSEPSKYDRGHVIADSMGGVANAYNVTPEIEYINVKGAQYKMETMFRVAFANAQTVTDFQMKIYYKDKKTNVPYKYAVKFKIDGKQHSYSALNKA